MSEGKHRYPDELETEELIAEAKSPTSNYHGKVLATELARRLENTREAYEILQASYLTTYGEWAKLAKEYQDAYTTGYNEGTNKGFMLGYDEGKEDCE